MTSLHWLAKHAYQPTKSGSNTRVIKNSQWSLYTLSLEVSARVQTERKLEYGDDASKLPDPYFMHDGWLNDPSQ